jgi:adenylate cyclase
MLAAVLPGAGALAMTADPRAWRNNLRLLSGLVLLSFVFCHLAAHCALLVSLPSAEATANILMRFWFAATGTGLLLTAALLHYGNALWSIYQRRSLRLPRWQWVQIFLGFCIPILVMTHVFGTRVAELTFNVHSTYKTVLLGLWVVSPWLGVVQALAVLTVWTHACIGMHFWLRTKRWHAAWRPFLFAFALLLPSLALAGFVAGGNEVMRAAENPDFVSRAVRDANLTAQKRSEIFRWAQIAICGHLALVLLPFGARGIAACRLRSARRCWKRSATTAFRTHRYVGAGRAAPPAVFWSPTVWRNCPRRRAWKPTLWPGSERHPACGLPARSGRQATLP